MPTATPAVLGWIGPERISELHYDFVRLVVDPQGYAHVAATTRDGIYYLTNASGAWTRERLTSVVGGGYDGEPSIALADDGSLAIAFGRFGGLQCNFGCYPVRSEGIHVVGNRSGSWTDPVRVVEGRSQQPSLQATASGLHLAYSRGDPTDRSVFYASEQGGQWTTEEVGEGHTPSLRVGHDGLARIAFEDEPRKLFLATAQTSAGGFTVEPVPGTWSPSTPLLSLDETGEPQIVFFNDIQQDDPRCGATYIRATSGEWGEPASLFPEDDNCQVVAENIDTDAGGALHAISLYDESVSGVWYANNVAGHFGAWQIREPRMFTDDGPRGVSALDVDDSGRPHILFGVLEAGAYDEDTPGEPEDNGLWYGIGPAD